MPLTLTRRKNNMTRASQYITLLEKGEDKLAFSEKEEIVNYIYTQFLSEETQKKELYFEEGWTYGHGFLDEWEAMKNFLYYEFGYDYKDALIDLDEEETQEWEGIK